MDKSKKNKWYLLCLSVMVAAVCTSSCNNAEKKTDETMQTNTETIQAMPDTTSAKADWEKFKQQANEEIAQSQDSINAYKKRIAKADKKLKMKYDRRVSELEEKNAELKKKLEDYKDEGKAKWESFKTSFNREMDKLKEELKDSTSYSSK